MIFKGTKRIFNSDKICRSYSDLNFSVLTADVAIFAAVHIYIL